MWKHMRRLCESEAADGAVLVLCTRFDLRQIIVTVSLLPLLDSSNLFQIIVNSFDDTSTERQYQLPTTLDVEFIYMC